MSDDLGDVGDFEEPEPRIPDATLAAMRQELGEEFNEWALDTQETWVSLPEVAVYLVQKTGSLIDSTEVQDEVNQLFNSLLFEYLGVVKAHDE